MGQPALKLSEAYSAAQPGLYAELDRVEESFRVRSAEQRSEFIYAGIFALLFALDLLASRLGWYAGYENPTFLLARSVVLSLLGLSSILLAARSVFSAAVTSLRAAEFNASVCEALAVTLLAAYMLVDLLFTPGFDTQNLFAAQIAYVVFLFSFERMLVAPLYARMGQKFGFRLSKLMPLVHVETGPEDQPRAKALKELRVGDLFRLQDGDFVPLDCEIVQGSTRVKERLHGAPFSSVFKSKGEELLAGSQVNGPAVLCRANCAPEDSAITYFSSALDQVIVQSEASGTQSYTRASALGVLLLACFAVIFFFQLGGSFALLSQTAAAVLLLSFVERYAAVRRYEEGLALTALFNRGIFIRAIDSLKTLCSVRKVVLDAPSRVFGVQVREFELLDQRVDALRVRSVAVNLLCRAPEGELRSLGGALQLESPEISPFAVNDFYFYEDLGVCGVIAGAEFSLGSEDFLVERGVYVEQSDLLKPANQSERILYLALAEEVVARIRFAHDDPQAAALAVRSLGRAGLKVLACSGAGAEDLDALGKNLGLELINVHGGLSKGAYIDKLRASNPCAIVCQQALDREISAAAAQRIGTFNRVEFSLNQYDVTLLGSIWEGVTGLFTCARALQRRQRFNLLVVLGFFAACVALIWAGAMLPALATLISVSLHVVLLRRLVASGS